MTRQLVITEDGSSSIFIAELSEHYHSIHGALQESRHVFIAAGLHYKMSKQEIAVLEIGFGTGLNVLLTCIEAETARRKIIYTAIEKFPLNDTMYAQLNYCNLLNETVHCDGLYKAICSSPWQEIRQITDHFSLLKLETDLKDISFIDQFDVIYFDAFAPSAQPELWTIEIFNCMYKALRKDGILVTYCAKGEVKRAMKSVGFTIEALPGPKGKREMTRAIK